jgi:hypothetical protein
MKLEDLRKLVVETIKEQETTDYRRHPNRSFASYYSLLNRVKPEFLDIYIKLYDVMVNQPEAALAAAEELDIDSSVVQWHGKDLANDQSLPSGDDILLSLNTAGTERATAAQKHREKEKEMDTRTQADFVYPRDPSGKIIGRAD